MLGMGRKPAVDQRLHYPRAPQRAADRGLGTGRVEVPGELRLVGVAGLRPEDLVDDVPVRDVDPLAGGDLAQDQQGLGPLLGARPELRVELVGGLAGRREIGLLGDPLAGERPAQLVVHHLDLFLDEDVGEVDGRVLHGIVDDPVREAVAGPVQGVALQPLADLRAEGGHVGEVAHRRREVVVGRRQQLLAELLQLHAEVALGTAERLLLVVVGEGDVELDRIARLETDEVLLEPGDEPLLADDERHPVRGAAVEGDTVTGPDEADDRPVSLGRRALLDGAEGCLLVAELVHDALDLGIVDGFDLGLEREAGVVTQLHLGAHRDGRLVPERLAFLRVDQLDVRPADDHDRRVVGRAARPFAVARVDERLDGLLPYGALAEDAFQHAARGLAGTEACDAGALAEAAGGVGDAARNLLDGELDLDDEGALLGGGRGHMHGRRSIGAASRHRRSPVRADAGHDGPRTGAMSGAW